MHCTFIPSILHYDRSSSDATILAPAFLARITFGLPKEAISRLMACALRLPAAGAVEDEGCTACDDTMAAVDDTMAAVDDDEDDDEDEDEDDDEDDGTNA